MVAGDTGKPKASPAIQTTRRGTTVLPISVVASNCKANRVARLAPKAIAGATTTRGFGWIMDAARFLQLVEDEAGTEMLTQVTGNMGKEMCGVGGIARVVTVDTGRPKPFRAIPMMRKDTTAQPTLVVRSGCRTNAVAHLARRATAGDTMTRASG